MSEHGSGQAAGDSLVPAEAYTISDVDAPKVLADPHRLRLDELARDAGEAGEDADAE